MIGDESSEASGRLVAAARGLASGSVALSVAPKPELDEGVDRVLRDASILTLAGHGDRTSCCSISRGNLFRALPDAKFDFGKRASRRRSPTAGGLLAVVVGGGVLPESTISIPSQGYAALAAHLRGRRGARRADVRDPPGRSGRGATFCTFFVVSAITVWASIGQLWTLLFLTQELGEDQGFSDLARTLAYGAFGIAFAALLVYTVRVQVSLPRRRTSPRWTRPRRSARRWRKAIEPLVKREPHAAGSLLQLTGARYSAIRMYEPFGPDPVAITAAATAAAVGAGRQERPPPEPIALL